MGTIIMPNTPEENRFKTISEFKWCINDGGEVEFEWKGIIYSITHQDGKKCISEAYKQETEFCGDTVDEILEYIVGGDKLYDVITEINVLDRSI